MTNVERTAAGLQMVIPGCDRRTLPRSTTRTDDLGQGLLCFYQPPTQREQLDQRADAPLRPSKGQKSLPPTGLFGCHSRGANPFA
jgi:hypothetical protein